MRGVGAPHSSPWSPRYRCGRSCRREERCWIFAIAPMPMRFQLGARNASVGGGRENFVLLPIIPLPAKTKLPTARAGKVGAQDSSGGPATPVAPPLSNARSRSAEPGQHSPSEAEHQRPRASECRSVNRVRVRLCPCCWMKNSLLPEKNFLIQLWKFPVPLHREFGWKLLNSPVDWTPEIGAD
jgi:hypothetical protein